MNYLEKIKTLLYANADALAATPMQAYMKDKFGFLGINAPRRKELMKAFFAENGLPSYDEMPNLVRELFAEPHREFHYFAIEIVFRLKKQWQADLLPLLEWMIVTNSWWDSVDGISSQLVSPFFEKFPQFIPAKTDEWNGSANFWLVRVSIIYQLSYGKKTDTDLLFAYILPHCGSKEFFVQKAMGWALRQYSRTDAYAVKSFVEATPELPALSKREALRLL